MLKFKEFKHLLESSGNADFGRIVGFVASKIANHLRGPKQKVVRAKKEKSDIQTSQAPSKTPVVHGDIASQKMKTQEKEKRRQERANKKEQQRVYDYYRRFQALGRDYNPTVDELPNRREGPRRKKKKLTMKQAKDYQDFSSKRKSDEDYFLDHTFNIDKKK